MIGALLRWLPLSLALHAAALAATLLVPGESALAPLFVDLTLRTEEAPPTPTPAGGDAAPDRVPGRRATPGASSSTDAGRRSRATVADSRPPARDSRPPAASPRPVAPPLIAATPPANETPPESPAPVAPPATAPTLTPPPPAVSAPETSFPTVAPPAPPSVAAVPTPAAPAAADASPPPASGMTGGTARAPFGDGRGTRSAPTIGGGLGGRAGAGGGAASGAGAAGGGGTGGDGALALAVPGDGGGAYAAYLALLRRRVQEALTYPAAARRRSLVGTVHLEISIDLGGRITGVELARSSFHELLDEAALDAVRAVDRVPFPPDVRPRVLRVRLPVTFELR